jgi:PAS domain S-box-containing protein
MFHQRISRAAVKSIPWLTILAALWVAGTYYHSRVEIARFEQANRIASLFEFVKQVLDRYEPHELNDEFYLVLGSYLSSENYDCVTIRQAKANLIVDWPQGCSALEYDDRYYQFTDRTHDTVNPLVMDVRLRKASTMVSIYYEVLGTASVVISIGLFFALMYVVRRRQLARTAYQGTEKLAARLQEILDKTIDGIIGLNAKGFVEFVNSTAAREIGCSRQDAIGLPVRKLVHLGRGEEMQATEEDTAMLHAIEHGLTPSLTNATFWHRNGNPYPVEYTSTPILQKGRVEGAVVVFRNVAERRRIEQEQRLAAITFDSKEAMMVTDAQGTIMRVNQAFSEVSGYSVEEAVGRNAGFQKSGRHDQSFYAELWRTLLDNGYWEGELWNRRKAGEVYPLWYSISAVRNDAGETTHYVSHATDLSLVKQTELELRAAIAKAEAANQAKAGFLATMSHEMRTPLNAVLGMLGLLQDAELSPRLRDYVTTAREAGEGLLDLISDILDFSKMDAGKLELERTPFDSVRLLSHVSALLQQRAEEKGLRFEVVRR